MRVSAVPRPSSLMYYRQHQLKIKVARIFKTYGPRMHPNDGRVVANFILQALRGSPSPFMEMGRRHAPSVMSMTW